MSATDTVSKARGISSQGITFGEGGGHVGDVHSLEKGSGARFNAGKPDISLIPLEIIANNIANKLGEGDALVNALRAVGKFQMGEGGYNLYNALSELGTTWDDCARVFEYGKKKYAAWNWAKGMAWSIPIACIGRHALKIAKGEEIDDESGLPHTGHIECNIVMLLHYIEHYPEGDDRIKLA